MDVDSALPKFIKILTAVGRTHEQGKQHHQLSPDSIRLNEKGDARIPLLLTTSLEKTTCGSPQYSAPEDFEPDPGVNTCSSRDTYVLGFIFYEILLGRNLFRAEFAEVHEQGEMGWLRWHADKGKSAKPLTQLISGFPHGLSDLIGQMLIKDPKSRTADLQAIKRWFAFSRQLTKCEGQTLQIKGEAVRGRQMKAATRDQKLSIFIKKWSGACAFAKLWNCMPLNARDTIRNGAYCLSKRMMRSA